MFDLGFTKKDAVRAAWSFLAPFVVVFAGGVLDIGRNLIQSCTEKCDFSAAAVSSKALAIGIGSSILVSLKNFVLKDGSKLKG